MSQIEECSNPFKKRKCGKTDIVVYICRNGEKHPICSECWKNISESDLEWTE